VLSTLLAIVFSNVMLRPLANISAALDRISAAGGGSGATLQRGEPREVAEVQSKLNLLGEEVRGARQMRSNIEQLFERLEEAILFFDGDGRLAMAGHPAERILRRSRGEMLGRPVGELLPPESALGSVVHASIETRRPARDKVVDLPAGNGPARMLVDVNPIEGPDGRYMGAIVTLSDAESRQELQRQINMSDRLAAITRLTGGVAHEIKNPLNAITLHLEVLTTKLAGENVDAPEVEVIRREIQRLDRVVKTFLDFTRPVKLTMRAIDLADVIQDVMALVKADAERRGMSIELSGCESACLIAGDRDLLKQALLNVVVNGLEAMDPGGRLEVRMTGLAGEYEIAVTDQGRGIPPELRERIFNLYFTTKSNGTGIGLAITFQVVQLHNGTIDLSSEPGKGATFRLRFPALRKEEALAVRGA
jgi:signal transduction histidine kinase